MKALNQKGKSPVVIHMVQTEWNEALTKPSSMISTTALMLGTWIILLSLINMFGGGAGQAGNKVAWIGFIGISGDAFVPYDDGLILDDAIFAVLGLVLFILGLRQVEPNPNVVLIVNLPAGFVFLSISFFSKLETEVLI